MAVHAQSLPVIAQHPIENVIKNFEQPTTQQTQQKTKQNHWVSNDKPRILIKSENLVP